LCIKHIQGLALNWLQLEMVDQEGPQEMVLLMEEQPLIMVLLALVARMEMTELYTRNNYYKYVLENNLLYF